MPHRFQSMVFSFAGVFEFVTLSILATVQGIGTALAFLSEGDWLKVFGPNGVAFVAVLACIVLWGTFIRYQSQSRKDLMAREAREKAEAAAREKREEERRIKEDEARERRHQELVATNGKNAEDLKALTVEAIKAQMIVAAESKAHANNAQLLSMNVHDLCDVLKKSPCLATMMLRQASNVEMSKDSRL